MFGILDEIIDVGSSLVDKATDEVEEFVGNPIGKTVKVVTQPVRDILDVVDGLTEGELRTKATLRLGADAVSGMALGELITWYNLNE